MKIQTAARCESLNLVSAEISSAVLISSRNAKFNHTLKNISDFFLNGHKIGSLKAAYHLDVYLICLWIIATHNTTNGIQDICR